MPFDDPPGISRIVDRRNPSITPCRERADDFRQRAALFSQPIAADTRPRRQATTFHDTAFDQPREPRREDVSRDSQALAKLVETRRPEHALMDDEQAPSLADLIERTSDGALH